LRETIAEKFAKISSSSENKPQFCVNLLPEMKPYAYLADPNEPVISPDDWEINQSF